MEKNSVASLLTSVDNLFTTQEERNIASQPRVQEIPVDKIDDFPNHPFKVRMDDSMIEMVASVKQHGTLPQMEQIINLYLDRVVVFPDYVEIHLNNVPTNLLNPSQTKDEHALDGLYTFYIEKMSDNILPKYQTGKIG